MRGFFSLKGFLVPRDLFFQRFSLEGVVSFFFSKFSSEVFFLKGCFFSFFSEFF